MKLKLFVAMLAVSVLIGCTRKSDLELRTEEYDVIEEGTADGWPDDLGVTPVAPLTDTDVDTTTSFSILGTDVPADSTALPEEPALAGRLGGAVTPAPVGPAGPPPAGREPVSRTPSASADAPPRSQQPPASPRPAPVPREPAPTPTRPQEPAEERAPQPEPAPAPEPEPAEPEPTPPTTTQTETAPRPDPVEPAPDPPPSEVISSADPAARL